MLELLELLLGVLVFALLVFQAMAVVSSGFLGLETPLLLVLLAFLELRLCPPSTEFLVKVVVLVRI